MASEWHCTYSQRQ